MLLQPLLRLVHYPKDLGIASDDHQAGYNEGGNEQRRLAAVSMHIAHDRAGLQAIIVAEATPHAQQRGQLHAIGDQPAGSDHDRNPVSLIDPGVQSMMGDHHIAIDGDHRNAEQRDTNVAILDERDQAAEHGAMSPGALNETQTLEGQYQRTEQQIGYAEAAKISSE